MRSTRSLLAPSLAALLAAASTALVASGCGGDADGSARWEGRVDTLAGGGVRVVNPATGVWTAESRWHLVEELRIGTLEGDGPDLLGEIADLAVDPEGRIYVLEAQADELRIFGPDGTHLRTVGGEGSGPGELNIPFGGEVLLQEDGRVWINNAMNRRWELFSMDGEALGSTPHHSTFFGGTTVAGRDGGLYQQDRVEDASGEARTVLVRKAVRGDSLVPTDTLAVPEIPDGEVVEVGGTMGGGGSISMRLPVPFVHQPSWQFDPRGFFWIEPGTGYRLVQLSPEGDTLRIVERAYDPVPVTDAELAEAMETFTQGPLSSSDVDLDRSRIPDHHPAFDIFRTDEEGNLWVRRALGADRWAWDVFDAEGVYLGEVASEVDFDRLTIHAITGDAVYGVLRGELDVPYVVRLAIREGGSLIAPVVSSRRRPGGLVSPACRAAPPGSADPRRPDRRPWASPAPWARSRSARRS